MLPEEIGADACDLSRRWILDPTLAEMLVHLSRWASEQAAGVRVRWPGIFIISGARSSARQAQVNPNAPASLHTRCPSLAADLRVGSVAGVSAPAIWDWLGARWKFTGGRWGGDFTPRDENHFDLGVGVSGSVFGTLGLIPRVNPPPAPPPAVPTECPEGFGPFQGRCRSLTTGLPLGVGMGPPQGGGFPTR